MEVIYSICSRLAGGGIGNTAYQAIRGIHRHGCLKLAVSRGHKVVKDVNKSKLKKAWYPKRIKLPGLSGRKWYAYESLYFDNRMAAVLKQSGGDIFHSWNGQCLRSLKEAKRKGMVTVVERASSHILTQMKLLIEEYEHYGITEEPELPEVIARCLEEYDSADYITVPSQFVYDSFLENGFKADKLLHIPFGVDTTKFKPVPKEDKIFRILFLGKLSLRKGVPYLLEAWNELNLENAELLLVGNQGNDIYPVLEHYRKKKNFKVQGYLSDTLKMYNSASVFVFPSLEEGSALVTYEAMSCGLPVITTVNAGSLVRDGKEGFLVPIKDVEALKEKITFLYENEQKRQEMGKVARERVKTYTWNRYGDKLVEAYRKVLKRR